MAAGAWNVYNKFKLYMADGTIALDTDVFHVHLFLSSSNCNDATKDQFSQLTNEVSGNGYVADTTNTITWTESSGVVTFDITTDPVYTASGGSIVARYAVIKDDTPTSPADPLVCYCLLDAAPADVTITSGNTLTIQISSSGVFTLQ